MSGKRFISAELWDDSAFVELDERQRLYFVYLWTNFDLAGVVQMNRRIDKVYLDFDPDETFISDFLSKVNEQSERLIRLSGRRLWLPEWVRFQQTGQNKSRLSSGSPVHKSVVSLLKQHKIYQQAVVKDHDLYVEFDNAQNPSLNVPNRLSLDYPYPASSGKSNGGGHGSISDKGNKKYDPSKFAASFKK